MQQRTLFWLIFTAIVVTLAVFVVIPRDPTTVGPLTISHRVNEGLDLQGGLRVLLEADLPAETQIESTSMETARQIVEQRVNALGVTEPLVQRQGERRIVVELPGVKDPQLAISIIRQTGLLEFVIIPTGETPPADGAIIQTYCPEVTQMDCGNPAQSPDPAAATDVITPTYVTLMTGAALQDARVDRDQLGQWIINFQLQPDSSTLFGDFTSLHQGDFLAIVLDKEVLSAPRINNAITGGQGTISGSFTQDSANALALQLRYGSLPVPLKVAQSSEIGPSLGQDSVRQSTLAGAIGLGAVVIFMLLYYRLPGVTATIALAIYAVVTFALFILFGITLTLPGIAGFVLSVGVAVDANVLIFERMKEELRGGRTLKSAVDAGFSRAWPSIRDSNISTLITCIILFWFGNTFGASIVKGFALTLALGVGVSLFTAILVTRTLMHVIMDRIDFSERHSWFGI
jgi:protein-export membrane protein SecD